MRRLLIAAAVAVFVVACHRRDPLRVDVATVPTTAVAGTTYETTLHANRPATFTSCSGAAAPYRVSPTGTVTWVTAEPETQEICVLASEADGTPTRVTWRVTSGWAPGGSPDEARQRRAAWGAHVASIARTSIPSKCSTATLTDVGTSPVPVMLDLDFSFVGDVGSLDAFRSLAFTSTGWSPASVANLERAPWIFLVRTAVHVEPELLLHQEFTSGHFVGDLALIDLTHDATQCVTPLVFASSPAVETTSASRGVRDDFVEQAIVALLGAAKTLGPNLVVDLPNVSAERRRLYEARSAVSNHPANDLGRGQALLPKRQDQRPVGVVAE